MCGHKDNRRPKPNKNNLFLFLPVGGVGLYSRPMACSKVTPGMGAGSDEKAGEGARGGDIFQRTSLLLGQGTMGRLWRTSVLMVGVGGVGSWCAEALVRSGVGRLTLVDPDCVEPTNCNRQLQATSATIGRPKVEALRERLLEINPEAEVTPLRASFPFETTGDEGEGDDLEGYDFVVDAIDSLADKAALILRVTHLSHLHGRPVLLSSMGAGRRVDPTKVRVADFWQVRGDALGALLRKRFRREGTLPAVPFRCVYSEEPPRHLPASPSSAACQPPANPSLCPVTAAFGLALAAELLRMVEAG